MTLLSLIQEVSFILKPLIHILEIRAEVEVLNSFRLDTMNKRKVLLDRCVRFDFNDFKIVELFLDSVIVGDLII